ncbi:MAG: GspH/FimT family pseudopilin [Gammaproteobacteria bacterium]
MRKECGFTVVELLTTLAIVAILGGLAVPSFNFLVQKNRALATVNELHTAINFARQSAITRNSYVALCKSADGRRCNHSLPDWNSGWLIFDNLNRDSAVQVSGGAPILQVHGPTRRKARIISNRDSFTFRPLPLRSVNGTFLYCAENSRYNQALIVNVMGRVRISDQPNRDTTLRC